MKAIIIGYGSIGKTHHAILKGLGISVRTVDVDEIDNIDNILKEGQYDIGFVCTPTDLHLEHVLKLAEHGIPFFCEKPFYYEKNSEILERIFYFSEKEKLINMVACNWRFCDKVNSIPSDTKYIKVRFGHNLKQWRNDGKHLTRYSANKSMGGGILLDAIHEIDYLFYKFGEIERAEFKKIRAGNVTVDSEDTAIGFIKFKCGTYAEINLDYLSKTYQRYYEFLTNDSFLIRRNLIENAHIRKDIDNYAKNLYHKQTEYFINNVKERKQCMNNIFEADYLLETILGNVKNELFD